MNPFVGKRGLLGSFELLGGHTLHFRVAEPYAPVAMGDIDIEPPTAKENLFHPGLFDAVSSGGTPRKRNRFRRPATGSSNRSPLGDSSASGEATDAAAADAIDASAHELDAMPSSHPVKGVTITAEQMADLTKEERELLAKLSARLPALRPSAAEPTTPPAAAKECAISPPHPPPPPQPPTPANSSAAALGSAASMAATEAAAAAAVANSSAAALGSAASVAAAEAAAAAAVAALLAGGEPLGGFTVGANGRLPVPPARRKPVSPPSATKPAVAAEATSFARQSTALPTVSVPLHWSPPGASAAAGAFFGNGVTAQPSPIEVIMADVAPDIDDDSPLFSVGAGDEGARSSRSAGRRAKPASARRVPSAGRAGDGLGDEAGAAIEPTASLADRFRQVGLHSERDLSANVPTAAAASSVPSTAGIPGAPGAPAAGAGAFAPPPDLTFSIGAAEEAAARRAGRRRPGTGFARSGAVSSEEVEGSTSAFPNAFSSTSSAAPPSSSSSQLPGSLLPKSRSAWEGGGADAAAASSSSSTGTGAAAAASSAAPVTTGGTAGLGDEQPKEDPAWRLAEDQKERGNRRYAIKSWAEANVCYQKAISELRKHGAWGTATAEGRALNTRAASYHANSAAALMQLARMADAVAECDAALRADSKLGKALLRVAHVQLMLGDTDEARRFYLEAAQVGNSAESEAGLKACADDEQQAARLHSELIMCRRAAASTMGSAASSQQLKGLLNALETACTRSPHNLTLRSLQAEALSASGRMTEAHALCEAQLATPAAHRGHASLWHYTLGRVLYDSSLLPEAADKLSESLARPNAPAGAKPLLRLVQKLETERTAGNNAFKRGDWTQAVEAYTRALAVDPTHARFNALLYCNRGAAHAKNNALQQALADCSAAIALNRSYAKAYLRRGELRARCGDRSRALEDLGAAQRLDASGPVGQEAQRRVAELRKEQAREAANAAGAAAGAGAGWDRARAHHGGSSGYAGAGASSRGAGSERPSTAVAPPPKAQNHYEVLGVELSADADAIRKAYKKLCLKFHPDKHASSPMAEKAKAQDAFLAVQKAYDVLSDVTQRRTYDLEQRSRSRAGGLGGFGGARGAGPFGFASGMEDDLFSAFYGRHAQARAPPGRR